jgi:putative copper export protein
MIKKKFLSKQGIYLGTLIVGITLIFIFSDNSSFLKSYSQIDTGTFDESSSLMPQTETVTSYYDALLKIPLIVSQTAVIGVIFSHIFFQRVIRNHLPLTRNNDSINAGTINDTIYFHTLKRLIIILLSCGIAIFLSGTSLFMLQAFSLSSELGIDVGTTFTILSSTPVGPVWNIRVITSLIIITSSIAYYICGKKFSVKKGGTDPENNFSHKMTGKKRDILSTGLLCTILLAGAVSIYSNSMVSHNTALYFLPSLAISLDWFHFMAVSIWLGGLFYITTILLMTIKLLIKNNDYTDDDASRSLDNDIVRNSSYFLAFLLPYFSLIATISLGVIGTTGLYMAWIHLHTAEAILTSSYGNILTIKLLLILPMIILGGYHQIKLHGNLMTVAGLKKSELEQNRKKINAYNTKSSNVFKRDTFQLQYDSSEKFSKTVKIESLIGIGVLVAASFLTITSPPSISFQESMSTRSSIGEGKESQQDYTPSFDSFTILAFLLSIGVIFGSSIYFRKSKRLIASISKQA